MNKTEYKTICVLMLVMAGVAGVVAKIWLKPYVSAAGNEDFGLIDALPSFFYAFGLVFIVALFGISSWRNFRQNAIFFVAGAVLYEITQTFASGSFDWLDLIALLLGALDAWILHNILYKKMMIQEDPKS